MGHIHTGLNEYDTTASAYIVDLRGEYPRLLLHMHKKLHQWLQFGGHVEVHENIWQAVCHEVEEESGFEISQLELLQPPLRLASIEGVVMHPQPLTINTHQFGDTPHYHTDISYAFVTTQTPMNEIGQEESQITRYFSREELDQLSKNDIPENIRQAALFLLDEIVEKWERVPTNNFTK